MTSSRLELKFYKLPPWSLNLSFGVLVLTGVKFVLSKYKMRPLQSPYIFLELLALLMELSILDLFAADSGEGVKEKFEEALVHYRLPTVFR